MESSSAGVEVVIAREGSAAEAAQLVHAQVVPEPLHLTVDVGHSVAEFELQCVRLGGSAAHEDLDGLVGDGLVNAAAGGGDGRRWGCAIAGWWAFAPPRGRLELAGADHVRSVVRDRFPGGGGKRGVSAGFSGKGC